MSKLIPQSEIDRANSDIVSVIQGYLPELKKTGKNWSACCPFHSERSPSFTVNAEKEMYYCFGCGEGGGAVNFVMEHQGLSFPDAVESILGDVVRDGIPYQRKAAPKALTCSLPGHAEDRTKTAEILGFCDVAETHLYFKRNNTAPNFGCFTLKGSILIPLINNIGEQVNIAALNADGQIRYAAGNPSFGSTAILEPADSSDHDGKTIICADYAHAWRIWWSRCGKSRVLCAMSADNLSWMLGSCRDRFTHIGCDPADAEVYADEGYGVVVAPLDPYARIDRHAVAS